MENHTYSLFDQAEQSLQLWLILGRQGEELHLLSLGPLGAVPSALAYISRQGRKLHLLPLGPDGAVPSALAYIR